MRISHVRAISLAALLVGVIATATSCGASIHQEYYLSAYDTTERVNNYFRIRLDGKSSGAKTKFSVGFYDRAAVERLFGENTILQEYLATNVQTLDPVTGQQLKSIAENLKAAQAGVKEYQKERLAQANATIAELIGRLTPAMLDQTSLGRYKLSFDRAKALSAEAETELNKKDFSLVTIDARLREAQAILEAIRIAVDGDVIVRFFDGAGNELDVQGKTLVIFVATDVGRFSEAIRQLAEFKDTSDDVIRLVLGDRIRESAELAARAQASNQDTTAVIKALDTQVVALASSATADDLKKAILDAAKTVTGDVATFGGSAEIRGFAAGQEGSR